MHVYVLLRVGLVAAETIQELLPPTGRGLVGWLKAAAAPASGLNRSLALSMPMSKGLGSILSSTMSLAHGLKVETSIDHRVQARVEDGGQKQDVL